MREVDDPPADPYRILQVDPEADGEVIEAAFKRLARKYHPDTSNLPDAHDRMSAINVAYSILADPIKRAEYDRAQGYRAAGSRVPRPVLRIVPDEILVTDATAESPMVSLRVRLDQVDGPPFDPAVHRLELGLDSPWDRAHVTHVKLVNGTIPGELDIGLDLTDLPLLTGETYQGDIHITIKVEV